jgi:hypothetical protein
MILECRFVRGSFGESHWLEDLGGDILAELAPPGVIFKVKGE